jgi:hypothetical protein
MSIRLVVLVCLYEALTKGWATLLLLPASLVLLPLYIFLQYAAMRHEHGPYRKSIRIAAVLLTTFLLAAYVGTVGSDDTDRALLFGFYTALDTSALAKLAQAIGTVAYVLMAVVMVWLIGLLVASRRRAKNIIE